MWPLLQENSVRISTRYAWAIVSLALPLARCATSNDVEMSAFGGDGAGHKGGATTSPGNGGFTSNPNGGTATGSGGSSNALGSGGTSPGAGGAGSGGMSGGTTSANGGSSGGANATGGISAAGTTGKGGAGAGGTSSAGATGKGGSTGVAGSSGKGGMTSAAGGTTSAAGGSVGTAGLGSGGGAATGCLADWKADATCGPKCTGVNPGDETKCAKVVDCYAANSCGPTTCATNDQKCGSNTLGLDASPYASAKVVYECMCN
jgi:hypothetical protein